MQNIAPVKTFLSFDELSERLSTNRIIVHHTAVLGDLSARDIHTSHLNIGYSGIGYHFVVRKNGAVEAGRPIWAIGAHAFGCNSDSIGICVSGNFDEELPTHYQIESTALLLANLCRDLICLSIANLFSVTGN